MAGGGAADRLAPAIKAVFLDAGCDGGLPGFGQLGWYGPGRHLFRCPAELLIGNFDVGLTRDSGYFRFIFWFFLILNTRFLGV